MKPVQCEISEDQFKTCQKANRQLCILNTPLLPLTTPPTCVSALYAKDMKVHICAYWCSMLNVSSKMYCLCIYILIPMFLLWTTQISPSIVEQLSQGPSLVYNTFINDSFPVPDLSYALCIVPSFLQHG